MLVLTRKQNEGILIGGDITVTVIGIDRDKIRLGIEAPKHIRVIRQELLIEVSQENLIAAQSPYLPLNLKEEE